MLRSVVVVVVLLTAGGVSTTVVHELKANTEAVTAVNSSVFIIIYLIVNNSLIDPGEPNHHAPITIILP